MRYVVFIFALLGAAASGFLGYKWRTDANQYQDQMKMIGDMGKDDPRVQETVAEFNRLSLASYFLLAGGAAGVIGGILALMRKGVIAALLMLAAAIAPGVLAPKAFVFTSVLILAGVLAFFVRSPRPKMAR